jgi:hypothetical protein
MYLIKYNYKLALIYIPLLMVYIYFNKTISLMTFPGIAINMIGLTIIILLIFSKKLELLFLFFIFNILLGPFLIFNFSQVDFTTLGRLDYLVANTLMLYFIQKKYTNTKFVLLINILLFTSMLFNYNSTHENISKYYAYISNISIGFVFYYFWMNKEIFNKRYVLQIIYSLLIIHLALSIIQFYYPLFLRVSSIQAVFFVYGYHLNRPLGLLGASYVYGLSTIFVLMFYYHYKNKITYFDKHFIFFFIIMSSIATRTVLLGLIFYILYLIFIKLSKIKKLLFLTFIIGISTYFIIFNYQLLFLNQSNSTKLLLWYLTLKDIFHNSSLLQILFGHGIASSELIANQLPDFVSNMLFEARYDNRVDSGSGEGFPIHNIYIQMLYENGIFVFVFISYYILKIFKNVAGYKLKGLDVFLLFLITVNYFLHNGIYSNMLFFIIFTFLDKRSYIKRMA